VNGTVSSLAVARRGLLKDVRPSCVGVALVAALVVLPGCSSHHSNGQRRQSRPTESASAAADAGVQLPCKQYAVVPSPPPDYTIVGDAVALPASPRHAALQTSRGSTPIGAPALFAKSGLIVRAGALVDLVLPADAGSRLLMGWGSPGIPSRHIIDPRCQTTAGGTVQWLTFPGGFYLPRAACFRLDVRVGGSVHRLQIGAGRPCAGQAAPPRPNQT
jgi:hypothetical protein